LKRFKFMVYRLVRKKKFSERERERKTERQIQRKTDRQTDKQTETKMVQKKVWQPTLVHSQDLLS
jgi:hypothetical protein